MKYYEDPILGKGRAADVSGGTGSADYVGGTRIAIGGKTISFVNSATIQNVTGNSVTLNPDTAYKITATASAVTLNANVPAAGQWAYEGHAEIFVARTGYIVTGANVVLANPLEPDAVNNCVLRFHDGTCIIDVEDHVYGYIVTSISGTTQGTLPYGITSATSNYIAFDVTTNGSTIDLSGSTASAEKHIVGNGYSETTLTGAVDCGENKFTVANLALQDVVVNGGVMTLGDAYIPSGSTVAVAGGDLAVEKVTGNGGVIDFGNDTTRRSYAQANAVVSNINFVNARNNNVAVGGAVYAYNVDGVTVSDCTFSGGTGIGWGVAVAFRSGSSRTLEISGCTMSDTGIYNIAAYDGGAKITVVDTVNNGNVILAKATNGSPSLTLSGTYKTIGRIEPPNNNDGGTVTISYGATLDFTGNTNPTPIAPNGGVIVDGGCTVITSAGTTVSIAGGTYATIKNDGTTTE